MACSSTSYNIDGKTSKSDVFGIKSDSSRPVEHLSITWTINNFLSLKHYSERAINSPPIQMSFSTDSWLIRVYPDFMFSKENKIQFSLLRKTSVGKPIAVVSYRFGINTSKTTWFPQKLSESFPDNGVNFMQCDIPDYFSGQNPLIVNKLIVLCEMYVTYNPDSDKLYVRKVNEMKFDLSDLSLDLLNLSKKTEICDAVIEVKDSAIPVHKAILAARSSLFAEMFSENGSKLIVSDSDYDHINNILIYIYTANFYWVILNGITIGLYECAKRFKIHGLIHLLTPVQIDMSTLIMEESINFTWKIDNFSNLNIKFDECFTSPPFHAGYPNSPEWHLDIYPDGCHRAPDAVGIYLRTKDLKKLSDLKIHISILDEFKHELHTKLVDKTLYPNFFYGCPEYVSKKELHEKLLLRNDKLIVNCKINRLSLTESYDGISSGSQEEFICFEQLSEDLGNLLLNEIFTDCCLIAADKMMFYVHRAILSARSSVFERIIKEYKRNNYVISINEVSPAVLEEILYFCYTGRLKFYSCSFSIKLYEGAKFYNITILARRCVANLLYAVDEKSLCEVIAFSHKHEETSLFTRCLIYLKMIQEKVTNSKEWQKFLEEEDCLAYKIIKWLEAPPDKPLCLKEF